MTKIEKSSIVFYYLNNIVTPNSEAMSKKIEVIDIKSKRNELIALATKWYDAIVSLPAEIRTDEKTRTGVQVLLRQIGTRNQVFFSVHHPSEDAMFFCAEKGVRSEIEGDLTSGESANPEICRFGGSVTLMIGGVAYQASVSGLNSFEDVALALIMLSRLTGFPPAAILEQILAENESIPEEFNDKDNFLYELVNSYIAIDQLFMGRHDYTVDDILACGILGNKS